MEYFKHIKGKLPFYLSSGIISVILIFLTIVFNSYSDHLEATLADLRKVDLNKKKIIIQVKEIDATVVYLKKEFDLDADDINMDTLIFDVVDKIKKNLNPSAIKVSSPVDSSDGSRQNVDIEMLIKDYSTLVQSFHYLESFRIPKYKIKNFQVRKEKPGEMALNIYGSLVMPSL